MTRPRPACHPRAPLRAPPVCREAGATLVRDVDVALERAEQVIRRYEGGLPVGNDDAFQAAAELRKLYRGLLDHPEAEAGADLRGLA